jgi:hypothetical protein
MCIETHAIAIPGPPGWSDQDEYGWDKMRMVYCRGGSMWEWADLPIDSEPPSFCRYLLEQTLECEPC